MSIFKPILHLLAFFGMLLAMWSPVFASLQITETLPPPHPISFQWVIQTGQSPVAFTLISQKVSQLDNFVVGTLPIKLIAIENKGCKYQPYQARSKI